MSTRAQCTSQPKCVNATAVRNELRATPPMSGGKPLDNHQQDRLVTHAHASFAFPRPRLGICRFIRLHVFFTHVTQRNMLIDQYHASAHISTFHSVASLPEPTIPDSPQPRRYVGVLNAKSDRVNGIESHPLFCERTIRLFCVRLLVKRIA